MQRQDVTPPARTALRSTTLLLAGWFVAACLLPVVLADLLDRLRVGDAPLGFLFAQQGAVVTFVLLLAAYVVATNRASGGRER